MRNQHKNLKASDKRHNLERVIGERFDKLSYIFPETISRSDQRVRVLLNFFKNLNKGGKIIDVGCGKGRFLKAIIKKNSVVTPVGVDISKTMINVAKRNLLGAMFIVASATALPFQTGCFDYVFSVEMLEHIPNPNKAVEEMIRILKKRGRSVIIDKSKIALRNGLIPWVLVKKYRELCNRLFYPRNFPFTEKWFYPSEVDRLLRKYCSKTEIEYLKTDSKSPALLNLFVAWKGEK